MKKLFKRLCASFMVAITILNAAPLSGLTGLELQNVLNIFARAASDSGTCGDNLTWSIDTETGDFVISGTGKMDDFKYAYSNGKYCINTPWNKYTLSIKTVTIGNGIINIGKYAFSGCTDIRSVTIPNSVTEIGEYAFANCSYLKSITIPASVTSIGDYAFDTCSNLDSVIIPNGVKNIGGYAFRKCKSLRDIEVPDSVTSIGYSAFEGCNELSSVSLGNGITSIENEVFKECTSLANITIPDSITYIGIYAFAGCTELTSVTIPDSVKGIGIWGFSYCTKLTSITIPKSVSNIGDNAFYNCTGLISISVDIENTVYSSDEYGVLFNKEKTELIQYPIGNERESYVIPDGVKSIYCDAFSDCNYLTNVSIPDSITTISWGAFYNCTGLTDVYYTGSTEQWDSISFGRDNESIQSAVLHFVAKEADKCGDNLTWSIDTETRTLTISGTGEMYDFDGDIHVPWENCYNDFDRVIVEDGVTHIGACAFAYFNNVTDICLPDSVKSIGTDAFYSTGYYNDENNRIDGVLYIGNHLIEYTDDIPDVYVVPEGILTIADFADRRAGKAVEFILPDSLIGVGEYAFCGPGITIPVLGNNVIYLSDWAFSFVSFDKVEISDRITEIGEDVFNCCEIDRLTIPNTLKQIGKNAFMLRFCGDVYYLGTEEDWNQIVFETGNDMLINLYTHNTGSIHFLGADHKHSYTSKITTQPSGDFEGTETFTCVCGDYYERSIPAIGFYTIDCITIDFETNTISGLNAGEASLDVYTMFVEYTYAWEYETVNGKLGTGSKAILKDGDTVIGEYTILVYGDINGDSWYDGQDAVIVTCLANGLLSKEDVSETVYMAADCNHDGAIDETDVAILNEAGVLITDIDQSKSVEELLTTSSVYVKYLDVIDQSFEIGTDKSDGTTDASDAENTTQQGSVEMNIVEMIINYIRSIFKLLITRIPVLY